MENAKQPAIIGFYGYSQSGKTTIIRKIIEDLQREGIVIGVIKQTDKPISSEQDGKDTMKFRDSGSPITSFSSISETNFVVNEFLPLNKIVNIMALISKIDLVFVESARDPSIPKIRIGDIPVRENTLFTYDGNIEKVQQKILEIFAQKGKNENYC